MQPTTTIDPASGSRPDEAEVLGLDAAGTMGFVLAQQRAEHLAAAARVRAVCHWADLHRVDGLGAVDPEVRSTLSAAHGLAVHESVLGMEGELRLAQEGAFRVAEFAVTELAAALGLSEPAGRAYVGQCLELRDRLPGLWLATMGGRLPAWKALQVARLTIPLNATAAAYVDAHLAPFASQMTFTRITRAVEAAIERHDPVESARRTAAAAENRGVWVDDRIDGTSMVTAVTDTPHAMAFGAALDEVAATLGVLGDTDPHQVRRAKAVGVLADPQGALDLQTAGSQQHPTRRRGPAGAPSVHLHLHTAAVGAEGVGMEPVARVEGIGARSTAAVRRWLGDLAPGAVIAVTPVVDLTERISVDAYEAPDRLRRLVEQRDHTGCRFPWCGRRGRYDLDHIVPYVALEDGGSAGQTNQQNLARLCRFHHRVKTRGEWRYERSSGGDLVWTSPLGWRYGVDEHGTRPLTVHTID